MGAARASLRPSGTLRSGLAGGPGWGIMSLTFLVMLHATDKPFQNPQKSGHFIEVCLFLCLTVSGSYSTSLYLFEFNQKYIEEV